MKMDDFEKKLNDKINHFKEQLSALRVGSLSVDSVGNLPIDAYGSVLTLKELANLTFASATEIIVSPWDKSIVGAIETSLRSIHNAGFSIVADSALIRIKASELTQERREALVKEIAQKKEETKVAIRLVRQDQMKSLDEMEENDEISEDEKYQQREQVEETVKKFNDQIEEISQAKQKQISTI